MAIIKHANPCGIAVGADVADAHAKAHACDPVSAYGGVVATNSTVTLALVEQLAGVFTEVLAAPGYEPAALELLQQKKNLRVLRVPAWRTGRSPRPARSAVACSCRRPTGSTRPATTRRPGSSSPGEAADEATLADLRVRLAGGAGREVQRDPARAGRRERRGRHGAGQPGRLLLAGGRPGRRRIERAARSRRPTRSSRSPTGRRSSSRPGVKAIVQPGGSIRDEEVIAAARTPE